MANTSIPTSETDACIAVPPRMAAVQPAPPANTSTNRAMGGACIVVPPPTAAALPVPPVSMNTRDGGQVDESKRQRLVNQNQAEGCLFSKKTQKLQFSVQSPDGGVG